MRACHLAINLFQIRYKITLRAPVMLKSTRNQHHCIIAIKLYKEKGLYFILVYWCRFLLISSGPVQTSIDRDIDQDDKTKSKSENNKTEREKVNF